MKLKTLVALVLTFLVMACSVQANSFADWADEIAQDLRIEILQNNYARRLVFPKKDRIPTVARAEGNDTVIFSNIHDNNELWTGRFPVSQLKSAEIMNIPIAPGVFHFGTLFHFNEAVTLTNHKGESKQIKGLLMGTGPEKDFSVQGIAGFQLIQMRAYSIEFYESKAPVKKEYRHLVNTKKVDLGMFFLAHAEETARLAAMTYLRALSAENPEISDHLVFQKYNVLGANCVSSGIQNLARAIRPEYQKPFLKMGKKDISRLESLSAEKFIFWINAWHQVSLQALRGIVGRSPDQNKFKELEEFHNQLRRTNLMSLPWRAKPLIDWATR